MARAFRSSAMRRRVRFVGKEGRGVSDGTAEKGKKRLFVCDTEIASRKGRQRAASRKRPRAS